MSKRKFDTLWVCVTLFFVLLIAGPFYTDDTVVLFACMITIVITMFSFSLYKGMLKKMKFIPTTDSKNKND
jgi:hypothetical protein